MNRILDHYLFEAFSNASDNLFVYVTDVKKDLSRWSKKAVDFFGLEEEYFTGAMTKWLEHVHPDDKDIYLQDIQNVFDGKSVTHNCQYRAKNRYGEYVWVECRGSMIRDDSGNPIVFAGIMTRLDNQNKYDNLTHLLTGFELLRTSSGVSGSLMLIGIDRLRDINSQHGLLYGNRVIVHLAQTLEKYVDGGVVYRFQGDDFAVYGKDVSTKKMSELFRKVQKECKSSEHENGLIDFQVSAGITAFLETDDITDILAKAELSLSFAKRQSTTHVEIYSEKIEKEHTRNSLISEELIRSIKADYEGFRLVYQPILNNEGTTVVGCEALLRWQPKNKEIGPCYPSEFIPVLEKNGGIIDVGYFVMKEAIRQASVWQKKYKRFQVSFNVSYLQLEDSQFVPQILETVDAYKMDPSTIIVELTESVFAADMIMVKASFEQLKMHGIQIALDDFGTGNSSFWMLHNIDVDIVKLDQSFIRGLDNNCKSIDYAIVESVGIMCNRIGCKTVAEGVETDAIRGLLRRFQFTGLQGYLFSKPIEVEEFEILLGKYNMKLLGDETRRLKDMTYENLVKAAKKAVKVIDTSVIKEHLAVEFDIEGKGEGAFYVEFTEKAVEVEPYEYYDHDFRVRCSSDVATKLLTGELSPVVAAADGAVVVEGKAEKLLLLEKYLKAEEKPKKATKATKATKTTAKTATKSTAKTAAKTEKAKTTKATEKKPVPKKVSKKPATK